MFRGLVDDYRRLVDEFPVDQTKMPLMPTAVSPRDRWARIVRVMALRKFIMGDDDANLAAVVRSMNTLASDAPPFVLEMSDFTKGGPGIMPPGRPSDTRGFGDAFRDLVYGVYLHGDITKWERAQRYRGADELLLWTWTQRAEGWVFDVHEALTQRIDQGYLSLDS